MTTTNRRRWLAAACGGVLAALAWGCSEQIGNPSDPALDTLERARKSGTIRIGYANEAPYAYLDNATGRLTGEAPEIARVVLAEMGIEEVEGVLTEFGSLIPGLKAGRFDVIAAGMYILPPRCREVAFSNPTYSVGEAFVVAPGNPLNLHSYADAAKHASARLGVVAGTVERGYAQQAGVPDGRLVVFPDPPSAIDGVLAGRVDAYAATSLTVNDLLAKSGGRSLQRAEPFRDPVIDGKPARGYGAFAFRRDDRELREAFNAALARFIGTPRHQALVRPFGFGPSELPGDATADALCRG